MQASFDNMNVEKDKKNNINDKTGKGGDSINESGSVNLSCQASSTSCSVRNLLRFIYKPSIDDTLGSKRHLDSFF